MIRMLWTGESAMTANQNKLDAISNNLSNSNTIGYKKVDVHFKDLMDETFERTGYPTENDGAYTDTGVKSTEWVRDKSQGPLKETGSKSDIALDGKGYFRLQTPDNKYVYSRNGSFLIDSYGRLVDRNGDKLSLNFVNGHNENNTKFIAGKYTINTMGEVYINKGNSSEKVAEIPIFNTIGTNSMVSKGENLYVPSADATMYRTKDVNFYQGYVEGSNVDTAKEFTDMILAQRAFEFGSKGIKAADEMWGMVNNLRSR